jgi:hypothetical protein
MGQKGPGIFTWYQKYSEKEKPFKANNTGADTHSDAQLNQ